MDRHCYRGRDRRTGFGVRKPKKATKVVIVTLCSRRYSDLLCVGRDVKHCALQCPRSTDLLTARGVAHLVVHGTSGSTSYETIPRVRLETPGGVLSTVDMVVQRRDGPRRLRDHDDDDDVFTLTRY